MAGWCMQWLNEAMAMTRQRGDGVGKINTMTCGSVVACRRGRSDGQGPVKGIGGSGGETGGGGNGERTRYG